ncbi:hypothetical protein ACOMHN_058857 [Nucella lapillus]
MQLILTSVGCQEEEEDDSQTCFQGGADGRVFRNGRIMGPERRDVRGRGHPRCEHAGIESPLQRISHALSWARGYHDRKEAEKVLNVTRFHHRRSAVVEVYWLNLRKHLC